MSTPIIINISYWGDHTLLGWVVVNMLERVLSDNQLNGLSFAIHYEHAHPNPFEVERQMKWMREHGASITEVVHVQNRS